MTGQPQEHPDKPANGATIGPYSGPRALAKLDGRRKEARLLAATRAELAQHVGGSPSAVQRRLIDRAAMLGLRLALMDAKAPDGALSEKDAREYLCWNNAYARTLSLLGMAAAPTPAMSLADYLAAPRPPATPPPAAPGGGPVQHAALAPDAATAPTWAASSAA